MRDISRSLTILVLAVALTGCGSTGGGGRTYGPLPDGGDCDAMPAVCGGCSSDADCRTPTPRCDVKTNKCVACLPQSDNCPPGQRCVETSGTYQCTARCKTTDDCPKPDGGAGIECCAEACVSTAGDAKNCGACGKMCAPPQNAAAACVAGACGLGACNMLFADCDKDAMN